MLLWILGSSFAQSQCMMLASSFAFLLLSAFRQSAADPAADSIWDAGYSVREFVIDACIEFTAHRFSGW